ncbi:MAG: hypothetical protein ACRDZP_09485, partial [Acidimicrobiales bacterium]
MTLHRGGTVSLSRLAAKDARRSNAATGRSTTAGREVPLRLPPSQRRAEATRRGSAALRGSAITTFAGNVKGASGFDGVTSAINSAANSPTYGGFGDVSPPDQGFAAGPSADGTVLMDFVNQSLTI